MRQRMRAHCAGAAQSKWPRLGGMFGTPQSAAGVRSGFRDTLIHQAVQPRIVITHALKADKAGVSVHHIKQGCAGKLCPLDRRSNRHKLVQRNSPNASFSVLSPPGRPILAKPCPSSGRGPNWRASSSSFRLLGTPSMEDRNRAMTIQAIVIRWDHEVFPLLP